MELSVIIPTRNRPDLLTRALASIAGQTMSHDCFEVVVIDNGPNVETAEVASAFRGRIANLRYLIEASPGLHNARHLGMREARAELLVFADDDIEAFPEWLDGVWQGFCRHEAVLVGGKNLPKWEAEPPAWLKKLWEAKSIGERSLGYLSILDFGDRVMDIDPCYVWGCNFSIRKTVLLEACGFHPDSMPAELLHLRGDGESYVSRFIADRGYRSVYVPSASVNHFVSRERMTVEYFRKRAFNQGVSDSYTRLRIDPACRTPVPATAHPLGKFMSIGLLRQLMRHVLPAGVYLRANINEAYWSGFNWHEQRYLHDVSLRHWVLRENYLDARQ